MSIKQTLQLLKKAKELYQQHKYDECLIELKSLASERPDNLIIQLYIATVKFAQNQYEDSIKSCHEIINQASLKNNYHVLYMAFLIIGNAYYYHENTAKAFGYYEKALDIVIDHPSIITDKDLYEIHIQKIEQIINDAVKTKLEPLQLAQLYMLANQNPSALTQLQQCNGSDYVRYLSMHIHCKSGNNKQAKRFIKKLKKEYKSTLLYLGKLSATEDFKQAMSYFMEMTASPSPAEAFYELGNISHQPQDKINYYGKTLELDPFHLSAYHCLGDVYQELDEFTDAISYYDKALELNPYDDNLHFQKAVCYATDEQTEMAIACYKNVTLFSLNITLIKRSFLEIGKLQLHQEKIEDAIKNLSQAFTLDELDYESAYYLAIAYKNSGKNKSALDFITTSIKLNPENSVAYFERGKMLYDQAKKAEVNRQSDNNNTSKGSAKFENALFDFNMAITLYNRSADYFYHRAECHRTLNNRDQALQDCNTALSLTQKNHVMALLLRGQIYYELELYLHAYDDLSKLEFSEDSIKKMLEHIDSLYQINANPQNPLFTLLRKQEKENITANLKCLQLSEQLAKREEKLLTAHITIEQLTNSTRPPENSLPKKQEQEELLKQIKTLRAEKKLIHRTMGKQSNMLEERESAIKQLQAEVKKLQDEAIESKQTLTQALTKAKDEFEAQICALKNAHANEIKKQSRDEKTKKLQTENEKIKEDLIKSKQTATEKLNKTKEQHAVQISTLKTTYEDEIENIKKTQNALYKRIQQLEAELKQKDQVASQLEEKLRLSKQSKTLRMPPSDMFTAIFTDQGKFQINQHIHELMLFFKKNNFYILLTGEIIYNSQAKIVELITDCPTERLTEFDQAILECEHLLNQTRNPTQKPCRIKLSSHPTELFESEIALRDHAVSQMLSIDAIYIDDTGKVYTPLTTSLNDLLCKIIRTNADINLRDNPILILKIINVTASLNSKLDEPLQKLLQQHANLLSLASNENNGNLDLEKIDIELQAMFLQGYALRSLDQLLLTTVAKMLFPTTHQVYFENNIFRNWLCTNLAYTDARVAQGMPVSMDYIYSIFLVADLYKLSQNNTPQTDMTSLLDKTISSHPLAQKYGHLMKGHLTRLFKSLKQAFIDTESLKWQFFQPPNGQTPPATTNNPLNFGQQFSNGGSQ